MPSLAGARPTTSSTAGPQRPSCVPLLPLAPVGPVQKAPLSPPPATLLSGLLGPMQPLFSSPHPPPAAKHVQPVAAARTAATRPASPASPQLLQRPGEQGQPLQPSPSIGAADQAASEALLALHGGASSAAAAPSKSPLDRALSLLQPRPPMRQPAADALDHALSLLQPHQPTGQPAAGPSAGRLLKGGQAALLPTRAGGVADAGVQQALPGQPAGVAAAVPPAESSECQRAQQAQDAPSAPRRPTASKAAGGTLRQVLSDTEAAVDAQAQQAAAAPALGEARQPPAEAPPAEAPPAEALLAGQRQSPEQRPTEAPQPPAAPQPAEVPSGQAQQVPGRQRAEEQQPPLQALPAADLAPKKSAEAPLPPAAARGPSGMRSSGGDATAVATRPGGDAGGSACRARPVRNSRAVSGALASPSPARPSHGGMRTRAKSTAASQPTAASPLAPGILTPPPPARIKAAPARRAKRAAGQDSLQVAAGAKQAAQGAAGARGGEQAAQDASGAAGSRRAAQEASGVARSWRAEQEAKGTSGSRQAPREAAGVETPQVLRPPAPGQLRLASYWMERQERSTAERGAVAPIWSAASGQVPFRITFGAGMYKRCMALNARAGMQRRCELFVPPSHAEAATLLCCV